MKNFGLHARRFGWVDDPNTALDDFAFEAVLRINVLAESYYAAPETRPDVLPIGTASHAGASGKVCVRGGS